MKILQITSQHRRDFTADMICEHCEHVERGVSGYDDSYFHTNVIPDMDCKKCKKSSPKNYQAQATKYPEGLQV